MQSQREYALEMQSGMPTSYWKPSELEQITNVINEGKRTSKQTYICAFSPQSAVFLPTSTQTSQLVWLY